MSALFNCLIFVCFILALVGGMGYLAACAGAAMQQKGGAV